MKKVLLLIIFILSFSLQAKEIIIGTTQWCPYACQDMSNKGIVTEYITTILKKNQLNTKVFFLPWKRAISNAKDNRVNALLTAVEEEAPFLHFTSVPTMSYRSCLFSLKKMKPIKKEDFHKYKIGVSAGYSYGPVIDNYLAQNIKSHDIIILHGSDLQGRFKILAETERIQLFISEEKVAYYNHKQTKLYPVYCDKETPFYFAVSPKFKDREKVIEILDQELSKKENTELLQKIINESLK